MSALDKIRQAFPDLKDASDSELLGEISKLTGNPYESVATTLGVAPRGTVAETARQVGAGFAVDLPRMVGQGLQYTGIAPEAGRSLVSGAEERAPGWTPDLRGRGLIGEALVTGARAIGPMTPAIAASFVPGGQFAAPLVAGGLFGTSSAQETYEKLISQGVSEQDATAAARRVGLVQGPLEGAATAVGLGAFRAAKPLVGLGGTTAGVASRMTDSAVLKPFAKGMATNLVVQPGTEVLQDVGAAKIEEAYGGKPEDIGAIARQSALGGLGLTMLLGPLAIGGHVARANRADKLKEALYSPDTAPEIRAQALDLVMGEAKRQGVPEANVDQWFEQQLTMEDARNEELAALEETQRAGERDLLVTEAEPLQQRIDQKLGLTRKEDRKGYEKQFEAAFTEGTGQRVADAVTGVEREVTAGELVQRELPQDLTLTATAAAESKPKSLGVFNELDTALLADGITPTKKSRDLYQTMLNAQIDPASPEAESVLNSLAQNKPNEARKALAEIIRSRSSRASTTVPSVQQPAGSVGVGGAVVPGVVADTGSPVAAAGGDVQPAGTAGATVQQASVLPVTAGEPAAAVVQPLAPGKFRRAPKPMTVLEAARAVPTPPAAPVVAETVAPEVDQRQAILQQIFGQRNGDIIFDVVGMGMPEPEAAAKYGLSRQAIQKIAGATGAKQRAAQIQRAKVEKGITDEQIAAALATTPQEELGSEVEREIFGAGRSADAMTGTEAIEAGLGNIVKTAGAGTSEVEGFTELQKEIDATLEALAVETDEAKLAALNDRLAAQIEKVRAVEEQAKAEVRALAGRKSQKDAEEKAAIKAEQPKELGAEDAVQVESPAGVSVQPKAKTSKAVGGQVRSAKKPAVEGKAQAPAKVLTEAEQAAQAWDKVAADFPEAPKFSELTKAQQEDFIEFGPGNWERGDVELELTKMAKSGMKFGTEAAPAREPYTAKQLLAELKAFIRSDIPGRKLLVVDSVADLLSSGDKNIRAVGAALQLQGAYGVAVDGRAFLVANRIKQGSGRAKFMHEVGGHLGLDNLLTKADQNKLVDQIKAWAKSADGSLEAELALQAFERVVAAQTPKEDQRSELIAYFIESAMEMGIDPTAATDTKLSGPLRDWFRTLWAAFKVAARKLGIKPESMTAQDVVNLAYGAARLEINGTWHGTAAAFRNFRNKYIGSGEGATAYGWGTYLAQRVGIAKGYWSADVRRKTTDEASPEGNLMRVDTAVEDRRMFDYDKPVIKQPNYIANKLMELLDPVTEEVFVYRNKDVEELTGRDLIGTGEYDLGLLSLLIMDDAISLPVGQDKQFDEAVRQGKFHEAASHFLRASGIQGIKFYDARSRGSASTAISFGGKTYNRDELRDKSREASQANDSAKTMQFLMLRDILRNGVDDVMASLEEKVANQADSFEQVYIDSAARYGVKVNPAEERARAEDEANKTFAGQQLAWLKANKSNISIEQLPKLQNVIIFDDKDIFRVGAEAAADRQRMKFGKNAVPQGLIDRNIAKLPKQSQQPVKRVAEAIGDLGGKYLDYAVFTNDLVKRAQALGLGAAKTFSDRLAARNAKVSEEERKIEKIADGYALIEDANKGDGPGSVNEFLFESTRTGKWGYGKYRDAAMGAAFDKLGPKAQQFVKDVFAHGDATLSNKKRIVLNATNSEYDAMIKAAQDAGDTQTEASLKAEKAATLKRFQTLFRIREGVPYAPIKRTGSYVVIGESAEYQKAKAKKDTATVKKLESDPDHYHVSFVDTKWQARNLKDKLDAQGVFASPQIVKRSDAFDEAFSGEAMLPALTKMRAAVDRRAQDANGKKDPTAGKLLNIINQLYLEALAEGSARKSEMRRRGVAGEVDMLQSFTQQGRADANFLASVEYEPKIQDALQQMRNQSRTGDRERKSEIFDELTQRYADSMEPKSSPFINGLTNMASKFFLASSPGYYLQNLTQPFMMSLPAMAGRHDYTKAAAELAKAYTELGPMFKDVKLFDQQFDFSKVPADVRTAINDLVNQGKIDIGLATEINEYKVGADGNLSKFAQRLNKGMRMAVQKVEATNRLSTAIAAYRLEFAKTKDAAKATQYAAEILTDTHGDYTAFNAPRAFNTQWGKVALQFRKFQLIQIAFYAKLIRDAFTKPEERAAALRTLAYSLSHTAVFAGMMGLPGYAAISAILGFFGDDDEPYDLTADMRKALGQEWADMIMRGAPTVAGMDLSGKIGSGNMLSIMPFSDADLKTTSGQAEAVGTFFGGAALGMTSRVADGLLLMLKGDYYKGLERTMPKGVSDALKAGRQGAEGMTRRNGDVILPDSEIGAIDTVLTALGVPAVKQAVTYERQNRMRDVTENFSDRTTRIKNDYAKAVRQKDTDGMAEARAAWTKLQQTRQRNGLKPQPVSALLKAPQEQKAREQRTVGGVAYREGQKKLAESVVSD